MKSKYSVAAITTASGVIISGLVWLGIYILNYHEGIGFDGPAGGILGMTLIGGWILSSVLALIVFNRKGQGRISIAILTVLAVGIISGLGTGYLIGRYTLNHYRYGYKHPLTEAP